MALFSKKPEAPAPVVAAPANTAPGKKGPTPSRREAEAARMARLHPELDPKRAKEMQRTARAEQRSRQMSTLEAAPERQLARDVIDSRWNLGEFALPLMVVMVVVTLLPISPEFLMFGMYGLYAILALLALDAFLAIRKFRALAAQRIPGRPTRGMGMYMWNRQMSFRGMRRPAPRVQRGEAI